jgi:hypothetical protein
MLTCIANGSILLPSHYCSQHTHGLAHVHNLALNHQRLAFLRWPHIRRIQRPAYMSCIPEPLPSNRRNRHGRADVKKRSHRAAVERAGEIAVRFLDDMFKRGASDGAAAAAVLGVRGDIDGDWFCVRAELALEALGIRMDLYVSHVEALLPLSLSPPPFLFSRGTCLPEEVGSYVAAVLEEEFPPCLYA